MRTLLLTALLALSAFLFAGPVPQTPARGVVVASSGTFLINQGFEGTGFDNSETWSAGSWNSDYTTSPAPLVGSQSAYASEVAGTMSSPSFTAQAEVWFYFRINFTTNAAANNTSFAEIRAGGTTVFQLKHRTGNKLLVTCAGASTGDTVNTISNGTTYHIWCHYIKGTGANAVASVGFSSDGVRPIIGNGFQTTALGTATGDATLIRFNSGTGFDFVVDKVRVSSSVIGDNGEF